LAAASPRSRRSLRSGQRGGAGARGTAQCCSLQLGMAAAEPAFGRPEAGDKSSPTRLLEEMQANTLSVDKMAAVCVECASTSSLSDRACMRMAMCLTGLAAKAALDRLEQPVLRTCFQIFKARAPRARGLSSLLSLCKFALQARYGVCPRALRLEKQEADPRSAQYPHSPRNCPDRQPKASPPLSPYQRRNGKRNGDELSESSSRPRKSAAFTASARPTLLCALGRFDE